eukprot:5076631-Amphidinium_carterae.1
MMIQILPFEQNSFQRRTPCNPFPTNMGTNNVKSSIDPVDAHVTNTSKEANATTAPSPKQSCES